MIGASTALRFLQTSQNEFPLVSPPINRDTSTTAILHRYKFPGRRGPDRVSGTCARKEGLRTLTSPRREASLFKLGRNLVPANFFLTTCIDSFTDRELRGSSAFLMRANPCGSRLNS